MAYGSGSSGAVCSLFQTDAAPFGARQGGSMEYIMAQHLTKVYGHKEAVKDVSLHIREGQITA